MKYQVFIKLLLVGTFLFSLETAEAHIKKLKVKESYKKELRQKKVSKRFKLCTVSCSVTVDGTTYATTAGNLFTSCSNARSKCALKLINMF